MGTISLARTFTPYLLCFGESAFKLQITFFFFFTYPGDLISCLSKHKGPIFSLKWNKKGDYLLTGSVDKTAVVWDVKAEEWKQQFEFHSGTNFLFFFWWNNQFESIFLKHMTLDQIEKNRSDTWCWLAQQCIFCNEFHRQHDLFM